MTDRGGYLTVDINRLMTDYVDVDLDCDDVKVSLMCISSMLRVSLN